MGDLGGVAQAGASVADTEMTNVANAKMQQVANQFNAQQADIQRSWSAGQAATQRQFQDTEQTKAEEFNKMMSDTAMQRRVADLRSAGINPLLAAGNLGGASSPQMSAPSGSMPSGASASAAGVARMQTDPTLDALAGLKLTNAQAANVQVDTNNKKEQGIILEGQANLWAAQTTPEMTMKFTQALAAKYDMDYATASEVNAAVNGIRQASDQASLKTQIMDFQKQYDSLAVTGQRATLNTLIEMQNAVNTQQAAEARNVTAVQTEALGKAIAYAQALATPVSAGAGALHSAVNAAGKAVELIP